MHVLRPTVHSWADEVVIRALRPGLAYGVPSDAGRSASASHLT